MASKKNKKKKNPQKKAPVPAKQSSTPWIIALIAVLLIVAVLVFWQRIAPKFEKKEDVEMTSQTETVEPTLNEDAVTEPPVTITPDEAQTAARESLQTGVTYYADIDIQDYGTITVELNPDVAPITVANFVGLAEEGFYDGLTFHRIIETFMMQGGDPLGNGTGGSDMEIEGEFASNGFVNDLSHTRGAISMARSMDPNSASSQFVIVHQDSPFLDGDYAVFGYVTEGIEIVDAVCTDATPVDGNGTILAEEQPVINTVTIRTEPK